MPDQFAEILDDINHHIEREAANLPAPVAEALLRGDTGLTTVDVLRILAQPDRAANLLGRGEGSATPFAACGAEPPTRQERHDRNRPPVTMPTADERLLVA